MNDGIGTDDRATVDLRVYQNRGAHAQPDILADIDDAMAKTLFLNIPVPIHRPFGRIDLNEWGQQRIAADGHGAPGMDHRIGADLRPFVNFNAPVPGRDDPDLLFDVNMIVKMDPPFFPISQINVPSESDVVPDDDVAGPAPEFHVDPSEKAHVFADPDPGTSEQKRIYPRTGNRKVVDQPLEDGRFARTAPRMRSLQHGQTRVPVCFQRNPGSFEQRGIGGFRDSRNGLRDHFDGIKPFFIPQFLGNLGLEPFLQGTDQVEKRK
ncbi:MAG TPA: hypothetical protein PLP29_05685 [Candidatus Ozemobacteraceae bacterium]|nr:hypothetical protein [Candidatus Ozemobacteraceae bacterium]